VITEYDFTLPSTGQTLKWKPIKASVSIQISAQYHAANQAGHRAAALLGARITSFEGTPKPGGMSFGEITQWDETDLEAFNDHVSDQETIRKIALKKKGPQSAGQINAKEAFNSSMEDLQVALNRAQAAIGQMLVAADMMRMEFDPLGSPPSST